MHRRAAAFSVRHEAAAAALSDLYSGDGEVDAQSRRTSALEWLTNRRFGAASVLFVTVLFVWTLILLTGFQFFLRDVVVGHGIDAAFNSFGLIISFIYAEFYKRWRQLKLEAIRKYFRARENLKTALFQASDQRHNGLPLSKAIFYHVALYQAYNPRYAKHVYMASTALKLTSEEDKNRIIQMFDDSTRFLADDILERNDQKIHDKVLSDLLSPHVIDAKMRREVAVPGIYNMHTYFLFFFALFLLYPFATWVAVGSILALFAVPFVLFMLFVPFVVDSVIGDPWHPGRLVDLGAHEQWFEDDVAAYARRWKERRRNS